MGRLRWRVHGTAVTSRELLPGPFKVVLAFYVASALLPLPLGFIEESFAIVASVWGLYVVLPMVATVAAAALVVRYEPSRRWVRPAIVLVVLGLALHYLFWAWWTGPIGLLFIPPAAVIARAAVIAWR
jgi:hypothetical protein